MMKRIKWERGLLLGLCTLMSIGLTFGFDDGLKTQEAQNLHPANSVIYFEYDGSAKHKEAWENTAAYESLYKSGLMDIFNKVVTTLLGEAEKGFARNNINFKLGGMKKNLANAKDLFSTVLKEGASISVALPEKNQGPPIPTATIVVKGISKYEPQIRDFLSAAFEQEGLEIKAETIKGRKCFKFVIPETPGIEVGWWVEGDHLVIVVGMNPLQNSVSVAAGDSPNVTTNALYKKYVSEKSEFERDSVGWFNFGALRETFGEMPIPSPSKKNEPKKVIELLTTLGLHNLGAIVSQSGYKGKSIWTETTIEAPGKRTGLLGIADVAPFKLSDLPPLPVKTQGFSAGSVDYEKYYAEMMKMAIELIGYAPPREANKIKETINALPDILGFDPQEELFNNLGKISCAYSDPSQGIYGMGFGIAVQVKHPEKLRAGLNNILKQIKKQDHKNQLIISRSTKHGREIVHVYGKEVPFGPAFCVDDKWLIIGIVPQSVEAFLLRLDGKIKSWKPSEEHQKALAELPDEFISITMTDPRQTYETIFGIAPLYVGFIETALRKELRYEGKFPFKTSDLPPSELITSPMFPNFTVATIDKKGFHWTARSSVPSNPLLGMNGGIGGGSIAVASVGVALLLPAVQQAREAARRSTSKNNLKQLGLAMHNYHATHRSFPEAAIPNKALKQKQQLSFLVSLLPFLDQAPLYGQIDRKKGWDDKTHQQKMKLVVPVFLNPSQSSKPQTKEGYGITNYVGIAGIGKDAPYLKASHKRAGIFGYNRVTRIRDITDGTSNTVMMSEASKNLGPWGRAGSATVRPFTKKPYINGPDGIGGNHTGGCLMLLGDGSVRFISENIDPQTMEALSTISGGEVVREY